MMGLKYIKPDLLLCDCESPSRSSWFGTWVTVRDGAIVSGIQIRGFKIKQL